VRAETSKSCYITTMLNVGLGFIVFGLMLWVYGMIQKVGASNRIATTARIVGYKQFPSDKTITDMSIYRGQNFSWLRVVSFLNTKNNQTLEMYSNPSVANPEPIGTEIKISFDPLKTDPATDFVWVENGMRAVKVIAQVSVVTGLVVFVALLFVPKSSPLHFILVLPALAVVFIVAYLSVWKRPNQ
jgi:hypothetical protein